MLKWTFALCLAIAAPWWAPSAHAAALLDGQAGQWTDTFVDTQSVAQLDGLRHDAVAQALLLDTGVSSGSFTTTSIAPPSSRGWGKVLLDARFQAQGDVQAAFLGANGVTYDLTVTPSATPGFTLEADLSSVPSSTSGQLRVTLGRSGLVTPSVLAARVTWTPRAEVSVALDMPDTVCSGANAHVRLRASVSYADTDLVLVAPLPSPGAMSVAQPVALRFLAASHGGRYHPRDQPPLVVGGVTVPPHSVYWDLPGQRAGSTFVLSFDVAWPVGLLDTTPFDFSAEAHWDGDTTTATRRAEADARASIAVSKRAGGVYPILGKDRAQAGSAITYAVTVTNNAPGACGEDAHQLVVWDEVSELLEHPDTGNPTIAIPPGIHDITAGGLYTEDGLVVGGFAVPPRSVYWQLPRLPVGESRTLVFSVELEDDLPVNLPVDNCGTARSTLRPELAPTGCHQLLIGLPSTPSPSLIKGDTIRGSASVTGVEDNAGATVGFGEVIGFTLQAENTGVPVLNDVRLFDKIPAGTTFLAAWAPLSEETIVLYHLGGEANGPLDPPDITAAGDFDTGPGKWTTTPPPDPSLVRWVGAIEPALASSAFPVGDIPSISRLELLVRVDTPADVCASFVINNVGHYRAYGMTELGSTTREPLDPYAESSNAELVKVAPATPAVSGLTMSASPTTRVGPGNVQYTVTFTNKQPGGSPTGAATSATVDVVLPVLPLNGVETSLPLIEVLAPGALIDYSGLPARVRLTWSPLIASATRSALLTVQVPRGVLDGAKPTAGATVTMADASCGPTSARTSASSTVRVEPRLLVQKAVDFSVAGLGGELEYTLTAVNVGDGAATQVVVSDRIPAGVEFESATPLAGGEIWFSASAPPNLPAAIAPSNAFTETFVRTSGLFAPGITSGGRILSPYGPATTWIVFLADDDRLTPPQLAAGPEREMRFKVTIEDEAVLGSVVGNRAAIASAELLTAVGNTVQTTLSERPSLIVSRTCPSVVRAGESFTYTVLYRNDSTNPDTSVVLTDTLPAGLTYESDSHVFNATAAPRYGATPVPGTFAAPTLGWDVTAATTEALAPQEGGTFTVRTRVADTATSGTLYEIAGLGTAINTGGVFTVGSSCLVRVANPDLTTTIAVDQTAPISGDTLHYTVSIDNGGLNDAQATELVITLPAGVSYTAGTLQVTSAGWTLGEPTVTTDPVTGAETLTFTSAGTSTLIGPSGVAGWVPADAPPILLTLSASTSTLAPDTALTACSTVATTDVEEPTLPNQGCVTATVPRPDPYITKTGPATALPAERVAWTLTWGNDSRQPAGLIAFVDALPDGPVPPADGVPDVRFVAASGSAGETFWYHDAPRTLPAPAIDPADPAATGWAPTPTLLTGPVSHVAFVAEVGGASGPNEVYLQAELVDPITGELPQAGSDFENCVRIPTAPLDNDTDDNLACIVGQIPGLDLALDLRCEPDGARPGLRPGDAASYEAVLSNAGTTAIYGVRFAPTFAAADLLAEPLPVTVTLIDLNGAPRLSPVTWTEDGGTFYLGSRDQAAGDYYRRVGLRPGDSVVVRFTGRAPLDAGSGTPLGASALAASDYAASWQAGDPVEELLINNNDACGTTVWRPDPSLAKEATVLGEPVISAAPGTRVDYTLTYDNLETSADGVVIEDLLPDGLDFVVGSLGGVPADAIVEYTDGQSWGLSPSAPVGSVDPAIRGFRVRWSSALTAPPQGFVTLDTPADFGSGDTTDGTVLGGDGVALGYDVPATPSYLTPAFPESGPASSWGYVVVTPSANATEGDRFLVDVLDADTGADIVGFTGLTPDAGGAIDLSALDANTHPTIRLRLAWATDRTPTCGDWNPAPLRLPDFDTSRVGWPRLFEGNTPYGADAIVGQTLRDSQPLSAWLPSVWHPSGLAPNNFAAKPKTSSAFEVVSPNGRFVATWDYAVPSGSVLRLYERTPDGLAMRFEHTAPPTQFDAVAHVRVSDAGLVVDLTRGRLLAPTPSGWTLVALEHFGEDSRNPPAFLSPTRFAAYTGPTIPGSNGLSGTGPGYLYELAWDPIAASLSRTTILTQDNGESRPLQVAGEYVASYGRSTAGYVSTVSVWRRGEGPTWTPLLEDFDPGPGTREVYRPQLLANGDIIFTGVPSFTNNRFHTALLRRVDDTYLVQDFGHPWPVRPTGVATATAVPPEVAPDGTLFAQGTGSKDRTLWRRDGDAYRIVTSTELGLAEGTPVLVGGLSRSGEAIALVNGKDWTVFTPNLMAPGTYTGVVVEGLLAISPTLAQGGAQLDDIFRFTSAGKPGILYKTGDTWQFLLAPSSAGTWLFEVDQYHARHTGEVDNGFLMSNGYVWTQCTGGTTLALDRLDVAFRGESAPTLTYQAEVAASCGGALVNRAAIATTTPESTSDNNEATSTLAVERADLSVVLSASATVLQDNDPVTFTATVTNAGPNGSSGTTLTLTTPFGASQTVAVPALAANTSWTTTLPQTATGLIADTTLFASAALDSASLDCDAGDDLAVVTLFAGTLPNPWVTLSGPTALTAGAELPLTLTYGNNGNASVAATVSFTLPTGATFISSSVVPASITGSTLTWDVGNLDPAQSATILLTLQTPTCDTSALTSTAAIATNPVGQPQLTESDDLAGLSTTVSPASSALGLTLIPHRETASTGETLLYTAFVTNTGSDPTAATVTVTLPTGLEASPANLGGGTLGADGALTFGPLMLGAGATQSLTFGLVLTAETGALTPTVTAQGACGVAVSADTTNTATTVTGPGLHVVKSADRLMACGSELVRWTLLVTNTSSTAIAPTEVSDTVPTGMAYVSGSIVGPGADDTAAPRLTWALPELAPGNTFTLGYTTTGPDTGGIFINTVEPGAAAPVLGECSPTNPNTPGDGLAIVQGANSSCLTVNDTFEVTLSVSNGPTPRTGVEAYALIPEGLTFAASDDGALVAGALTFELGALAAYETKSVSYTVTVSPTAASGVLLSLGASASTDGLVVAANTLDLAPLVCGAPVGCMGSMCQPLLGCAPMPLDNDEPCTLDACTEDATCQAGVCQGGAPKDCDDGNTCTDDSCEAGVCVNTANTAPCDDSNACTTVDRCENKACVGSAPLACDDGNECTTDSCDPASGCATEFRPGPCNSGDVCGLSECVAGVGNTPPTCEVVQAPGCSVEDPVMVYGVVTDTRGVPVGSVHCTLLAGQTLTCETEDDDPTRVKVFPDLWCGGLPAAPEDSRNDDAQAFE